MNQGGSAKFLDGSVTFKEPINEENEELVFDFLLGMLKDQLQALKGDYSSKLESLGPIDTLEKHNLRNAYRLQMEEKGILERNREAVLKLREQNLATIKRSGG